MKENLGFMNLFGHKINFTYKNKKDFHSLIALLMSFIVYCLAGALVFYFSQDFIYKRNPNINYKEREFTTILDLPLGYLIELSDIQVKLDVSRIDDDNSTQGNNSQNFDFNDFLRLKKYKISDFLWSEIKVVQNYELIDENIDSFIQREYILSFSEFKNLSITDNSLIAEQKIDNNSTFLFKNYSIYYEKNEPVNKTINNVSTLRNFQDLEFIADEFSEIKILLYLNHNLLKEENLKMDVSYFTRFVTIVDNFIELGNHDFFDKFSRQKHAGTKSPFNSKSYTRFEYEYSLYEVKDDVGSIISNFEKRWCFRKKTERSIKKSYYPEEGIIYTIIKFDTIKIQYDRVYKKIQNILADIGGIFSSIIIFGNLLVSSYNHRYFNYQIMNFLFENGNQVNVDYINLISNSMKKTSNKSRNESAKFDNFEQEKRYNKEKFRIDEVKPKNETLIKKDLNNVNNCDNVLTKDKNVSNSTDEILKRNLNSDIELSRMGNEASVNLDFSVLKNSDRSDDSDKNVREFDKICYQDRMDRSNLKDKKIELPLSSMIPVVDSIQRIKLTEEINKLVKANKTGNYFSTNFFKNSHKEGKRYLKLTKLEYFLSFFCCRYFKNRKITEKERIFLIAENKINSYLNVFNYFDLFEDFEKLKSIVFNKNQNLAFKFLRKRSHNEILESDYSDEIIKTLAYLKENANKLSPVDEKIFSKVSKTFWTIYNNY